MYNKVAISVLFCLLALQLSVYGQWDDCPFGLVNDTAPGSCGRFVDTDGDGICDHSQPAPEDRAADTETTEGGVSGETLAGASSESSRIIGRYNLVPLTVITVAAYLVSLLLSRRKIMSLAAHRRFWNVLLLLTFIGAGFSGMLLGIGLDTGVQIPYHAEISFWHVEMGIVMTVISVFHALWHASYYMNIFRRKKEKVCF